MIQIIHVIKPSDQVSRTNFAIYTLERIESLLDYLRQESVSDEASFHVSGVVNRCNCRIWGSQNLHVTCKLERGSSEVNVWAGSMQGKFIGPFFYSEKSVTGAGAVVCAAPITTSNSPPTRWGTAIFLAPC
jgi:hypothetical protein